MARNTTIGGGILVALGLLLLANSFHIYLFHLFVPVALILIGGWLIYRRTRNEEPKSTAKSYTYNSDQGVYTATFTSSDGTVKATATVHGTESTGDQSQRPHETPKVFGDKIKYSKFIGDMNISLKDVSLQNVEISMFIGDTEVNVSGGKLQPGLNRMIISGFLGDCLVLIPKDMAVYAHCSGFIGDLELLGKRSSGFGHSIDSQTPDYDSATSKLYIAVNNFIGDIRVFRV